MLTPQAYRGEQLGLPESGGGSIAPAGPRIAAFIVDALVSGLVAALFVRSNSTTGHLPGSWSLIPLAIDYVAGMLIAGRTLGMYLFGLRIIRVDANLPVTPLRAIARTLMLFLLLPALIFDRDGRGLHDRYTDTAVIRS
jgi:uncharacterized RDD family membrane protein YckC